MRSFAANQSFDLARFPNLGNISSKGWEKYGQTFQFPQHLFRFLEFKPSFNQDVIETVAAFANTRGGRVVIGLSDSGEVLGTSFGREAVRDFVNRVSNATQPAVIPDVEKITLDAGEVVVLSVQEYPMKPVSVRGRCFKRSGSVTCQMMSAEIAEVHLQCTGKIRSRLLLSR